MQYYFSASCMLYVVVREMLNLEYKQKLLICNTLFVLLRLLYLYSCQYDIINILIDVVVYTSSSLSQYTYTLMNYALHKYVCKNWSANTYECQTLFISIHNHYNCLKISLALINYNHIYNWNAWFWTLPDI